MFCGACGKAMPATAAFCPGCGASVTPLQSQRSMPATNAVPAPRAHGVQPATAPPRVAMLSGAVAPTELLLVCAVMAIAGALVMWPVLDALPDTIRLFGDGALGRDLGLLLLLVWTMMGAFAAACVVLAWRLLHADRVARGLTYVLAGGLGLSILLGNEKGTQLDLVMVACFGIVAVLAFAPRVQAFFTGPNARQYDQPTSVVIARTLVAVWASAILLIGLVFLPLSV